MLQQILILIGVAFATACIVGIIVARTSMIVFGRRFSLAIGNTVALTVYFASIAGLAMVSFNSL